MAIMMMGLHSCRVLESQLRCLSQTASLYLYWRVQLACEPGAFAVEHLTSSGVLL